MEQHATQEFSQNLGAFGQRALDAFGGRLAVLFFATALIGLPMSLPQSNGWAVLACVIALAGCLATMVAVLSRGGSSVLLLTVVLMVAATTAFTATVIGGMPAAERYSIYGWLVAGVGGGMAAAR